MVLNLNEDINKIISRYKGESFDYHTPDIIKNEIVTYFYFTFAEFQNLSFDPDDVWIVITQPRPGDYNVNLSIKGELAEVIGKLHPEFLY